MRFTFGCYAWEILATQVYTCSTILMLGSSLLFSLFAFVCVGITEYQYYKTAVWCKINNEYHATETISAIVSDVML